MSQISDDSSSDARHQHLATTIDDLPEEVVLMILKLLDQDSLDQLGMAYEKWDEIAVFGLQWTVEANCVQNLTMLLKKVANVQAIEMTEDAAFLDNQEDEIIKSSELRSIKRVLLKLYNAETLQFLSEAQLEKLTVIGAPIAEDSMSRYINRPDSSHFLNFLAGQKNLTTLQLVSTAYIFKTPIAAENVPFKLKELSITRVESGYDNVLAFMKLHEDTLETLQLGKYFRTEIFEFIFAKLKKLKTLSLIIDGLVIGPTFETLQINPSVTTLKLFEHDWEFGVYKAVGFISKLPNLENLVLPLEASYEKLTAVLGYLKNLKHLTIRTFNPEFWQGVAFLKLESLKFFNAELNHGSDIATVAKNMNLKTLAFDGSVDNDFMDAISKNFAKLMFLDVTKSKVSADAAKHFRGTRLREDDFFYDIHGEFFRHQDFTCEAPEVVISDEDDGDEDDFII